MNISLFSSIITALVLYRLIEPAVDSLRGLFWGNDLPAFENGSAVSGASVGAWLDATREA